MLEELPQAISGEEAVLYFFGHPDTECTATPGSTISIGTEDSSGANGFGMRLIRVVSSQESVLNERANRFAMRASCDFELGVQIIEFELGGANPAAHDMFSQHIADICRSHSMRVSLEDSQVRQNESIADSPNKGGVKSGYDVWRREAGREKEQAG